MLRESLLSLVTALFLWVPSGCSVAWHRTTLLLHSPTYEVECKAWVSGNLTYGSTFYYLVFDSVLWPLDGLASLIHGVRAAFDETEFIDGGPLGLLAAIALPGVSGALSGNGDPAEPEWYELNWYQLPDDVVATDEAITQWFQGESPFHGKVEVIRREVRPEHQLTRENYVLDDEGWLLARRAFADRTLAVVDGLVLEVSEDARAIGARHILVERLAQPAPKSRILQLGRSIYVSSGASGEQVRSRLGDLEPGDRVSVVLQSGYYQLSARAVGPARAGVEFDDLLPEQRRYRDLIGKPDSAIAEVRIRSVTEPSGPGARQFESVCVVEVEVVDAAWNSAGWFPGTRHRVVWNTGDQKGLPPLDSPDSFRRPRIAVSRLNWWGSVLTPNPLLVVIGVRE